MPCIVKKTRSSRNRRVVANNTISGKLNESGLKNLDEKSVSPSRSRQRYRFNENTNEEIKSQRHQMSITSGSRLKQLKSVITQADNESELLSYIGNDFKTIGLNKMSKSPMGIGSPKNASRLNYLVKTGALLDVNLCKASTIAGHLITSGINHKRNFVSPEGSRTNQSRLKSRSRMRNDANDIFSSV
jgi:hypothetical protein